MALVVTDDKHYIDIANTIREKTETENTFLPEEMPDAINGVYGAGYNKGKTAFGVIGKESGTVVRADNVNETEHTVKVRLSSKNLLPFIPQTMEGTTGFYVTINDDGSITLNGESPYMSVVTLHSILSGQNVIKKGKTYIQTLRYADGSIVTNDVAYLNTGADWIKGDPYPTKSIATGNNNIFTVEGAVCDDEYYEHEQFEVSIVWQAGTYDNVTVYPQIEEATTATPYTPFVSNLEDVNLTACGKQLLPFPYMDNSKQQDGVTLTRNDDGSITLNGTPTATAVFTFYANRATQTLIKKGGTYTLSLLNNPTSKNEMYISSNGSTNGTTWDASVTGASTTGVASKTFTVDKEFKGVQFYLVVSKNAGTFNNATVYPQLEFSPVGTDFEPYKSPTQYTPNADGTLEIPSISPTMTLKTDKQGVNIECEYYLDGQAVIEELTDAIISLGGDI